MKYFCSNFLKMARIAVLVILFSIAINATATAQISVIIAKSSEHKVEKDDIKSIFTGAKITWANGNKIVVADQSSTDIGKQFHELLIGKSVNQVRLQWTKLVLSGQVSAPIKCSDDEAVIKAVTENPNTIGYISSNTLSDRVKELAKIE